MSNIATLWLKTFYSGQGVFIYFKSQETPEYISELHERHLENSKLFKKAEKKWIKHFSPNVYNSKSGPGICNLVNPNALKTIWQVRNTENNRKLICHSDFSTSIKLKCDLENNCYRNRLLQSDFNSDKNNIVFEIVTRVPRKDFEKTLYDLKSTLQEQDYGKIPEDYPILLYSVA